MLNQRYVLVFYIKGVPTQKTDGNYSTWQQWYDLTCKYEEKHIDNAVIKFLQLKLYIVFFVTTILNIH